MPLNIPTPTEAEEIQSTLTQADVVREALPQAIPYEDSEETLIEQVRDLAKAGQVHRLNQLTLPFIYQEEEQKVTLLWYATEKNYERLDNGITALAASTSFNITQYLLIDFLAQTKGKFLNKLGVKEAKQLWITAKSMVEQKTREDRLVCLVDYLQEIGATDTLKQLRIPMWQDTEDQCTAPLLWYAIEEGHTQLVGKLLDYGVDPNVGLAENYDDSLPLVKAADFEKNLEMVRLLLAAGASISDIKTIKSEAALELILHYQQQPPHSATLIDKAEPHAQVTLTTEPSGESFLPSQHGVIDAEIICEALGDAVAYGESEETLVTLVRNLASAGFENLLNHTPTYLLFNQNKYKMSLLWYATEHNYNLLFAELLKHKANVWKGLDTLDAGNRLPLVNAMSRNHFTMVRALLENSPDLMRSDDGINVILMPAVPSEIQYLLIAFLAAVGIEQIEIKTLLLTAITISEQKNEEEKLLSLINYLQNIGATQLFSDLRLIFPATQSEQGITTLLWYATNRNFSKVVQELLTCKVDVNLGIVGEPASNSSPLGEACRQQNLPVVQALLAAGADIAKTQSCDTKEVLDYILEYAAKNNQVKEVLKDESSTGLFSALCTRGLYELAKQVTEFAEKYQFNDIISYSFYLDSARWAYWHYPQDGKKWDALAQELRLKAPVTPALSPEKGPTAIITSIKTASKEKRYEELSGETYPNDMPLTKQGAVKRSLATLFEVMDNPDSTLPALFDLSEAIVTTYKRRNEGKDFPELTADEYQLMNVGGFNVPIPTDEFKGIHKQSTLEVVLLEKFTRHQLGDGQIHTLIAFIPPEIINNELIKTGKFHEETDVGIGNDHTPLAHAIAYWIIIRLFENNDLPVHYLESGCIKSIKVKDIISGLVEYPLLRKMETVIWTDILDQWTPSRLTFCSPFQLGSIIYQLKDVTQWDGAKQRSLMALSDSLIDAFCKAFTRWLHFHNSTYPDNQLTAVQFAEQISDFRNGRFNTPPILFNYAKQHEQAKNRLPITTPADATYLIVPKRVPIAPLVPLTPHYRQQVKLTPLFCAADPALGVNEPTGVVRERHKRNPFK